MPAKTLTSIEDGKDVPGAAEEPRREVRLALVLNGGVSLAVWMGGVVQEIDVLRRAAFATPREDNEETLAFWTELLDFLGLRVIVDVIAGTSAGGINGAFLATSIARGSALPKLRETWINLADFDTNLLDRKRRSTRRSVLKGDFFLTKLSGEFEEIQARRAQDPRRCNESHPRLVKLVLTGTALRGKRTTYLDDNSQAFTEADSRVRFVFRRDGRSADDFSDASDSKTASKQLARAARATASFPVAFEPIFVNATNFITDPPKEAGGETADGPDMSAITGLTSSRWMVDGGVLDNEPFEPLLTEIARRPVDRDVDRVIAYIVPALGEALEQLPYDDPAAVPGFISAALAAFQLPRELDVLHDLRQLRDLLDNADADAAPHRRLFRAALADELKAPADALFERYRRRRRDGSIWQVRMLAAQRGAGEGVHLRPVPAPVELGDEGLDHPWIPESLGWAGGKWRWGVSVADRLLRVLLAIVREQLAAPPGLVPAHLLPELRRTALVLSTCLAELSETLEGLQAQIGSALEPLEAFTKADLEVLALADPRYRQATEMNDHDEGSPHLAELVLTGVQAVLSNDPLPPDLRALGAMPSGAGRSVELVNRYLHVEVVEHAAAPAQLYTPTPRFRFHRFGLNASTSFLGGGQIIRNKLTGTRLLHFGAFFRQSWRAYDWTWGRLDGATHLIAMLVDSPALERALPVTDRASLDHFAAAMAREEGDEDVLRDALRRLRVHYRRRSSVAEAPELIASLRDVLVKRAHRAILRAEVPCVLKLEPRIREKELELEEDTELRETWTRICSSITSMTITQLTLTPEGREVVGFSIASSLRALSHDDLSIPSVVRTGLRWTAVAARTITRHGLAGVAARALLAMAAAGTVLLTVWTPLTGIDEVALRLVAAGLSIVLVPLTSVVLLGGAWRLFQRALGAWRLRVLLQKVRG